MAFQKGNKYGAETSKPVQYPVRLSQPRITKKQNETLERIKRKHNYKTTTQAIRHLIDLYESLSTELQ
jgi:hypothetical protein